MSVWLVYYEWCEDYFPVAVCSTKERAEAKAAALRLEANHFERYDVQEWVVDAP